MKTWKNQAFTISHADDGKFTGGGTRIEDVPPEHVGHPVLDEHHGMALAEAGIYLESYFNSPQDVEWCIEGDGALVLLQTRPLQTRDVEASEALECIFEDVEAQCLASGGTRPVPALPQVLRYM